MAVKMKMSRCSAHRLSSQRLNPKSSSSWRRENADSSSILGALTRRRWSRRRVLDPRCQVANSQSPTPSPFALTGSLLDSDTQSYGSIGSATSRVHVFEFDSTPNATLTARLSGRQQQRVANPSIHCP